MPQQTRLMKNVLGTSTTLDDAFLDSMREVVDPPADLVAATMCEGGAHKVFADLVKARHYSAFIPRDPCCRHSP